MPNRAKADLLFHPVRLRILQVLAEGPHTTREIAQILKGTPQPSIYRHLKLLLDGGMVTVQETRPVRGVQEKVFGLAQAPQMNVEDVAGLSKEENLHYFNMYVATLLSDFSNYLESSSADIDWLAEQVGFNEVSFYASPAEMGIFRQKLYQALVELTSPGPGKGRQRRKLAFISHPLKTKEGKNGKAAH